MTNVSEIWRRIDAHAGEEFRTITGRMFTYRVPGAYLRVINRSLSRTNFERAAERMPVPRPSDLAGRQGPSYTWAILMDDRIHDGAW